MKAKKSTAIEKVPKSHGNLDLRQIHFKRNDKKGPNWGTIDHAFSLLPGGAHEGLSYLEMARMYINKDTGERPNERFDQLMIRFRHLTSVQKANCSLQRLCLDVGIDPSDALAETVRWGMNYSSNLANAVSYACLPSVVSAVAKRATQENGHMDARIIGEATGWLPTSKGAVVNQQFNLSGDRIVKDTVEEESNFKGVALPAFEADTVESCEVVREKVGS